jgi:hypothetical protein
MGSVHEVSVLEEHPAPQNGHFETEDRIDDAPTFLDLYRNEARPEENEKMTNSNINSTKDEEKDRPKWTDKAIVVLTAGIVLAAITQTIIFYGGGIQTQTIITTAQNIQDALDTANTRNGRAFRRTLEQSENAMNKTLTEMQKQSGAMQDAAQATKSQSDSARLQAEASKSQAEASNVSAKATDQLAQLAAQQDRPWVGINGEVTWADTSENGFPTFTISYKLRNFGVSPAFNTIVQIDRPITDVNNAELVKIKATDSCKSAEAIIGQTGDLLLPNSEKPNTWTYGGIPPTKFDIPGCIVYKDTKGSIHHAQLCYWIDLAETPRPIFRTCWSQSAD